MSFDSAHVPSKTNSFLMETCDMMRNLQMVKTEEKVKISGYKFIVLMTKYIYLRKMFWSLKCFILMKK